MVCWVPCFDPQTHSITSYILKTKTKPRGQFSFRGAFETKTNIRISSKGLQPKSNKCFLVDNGTSKNYRHMPLIFFVPTQRLFPTQTIQTICQVAWFTTVHSAPHFPNPKRGVSPGLFSLEVPIPIWFMFVLSKTCEYGLLCVFSSSNWIHDNKEPHLPCKKLLNSSRFFRKKTLFQKL